MKHKLLLIIFLIILMTQAGCLYIVRYHGKVVDQETREPIEGAVVLGEWAVYHFGPAGGYASFYDARETVTDKNGEFTISGQGLRILSSVGSMDAVIYKSGYTYYRSGGWATIKEGMYSSKEVKWEGDMPVFPLRKLTDEERKKDVNGSFIPSAGEGGESTRLMINEINKERILRGYEPY